MNAIRDYLFSVIGGAMVCGVVLNLTPEGKFRQISKFLCGLFLTISLLHPLSEMDLSRIASTWQLPTDISAEDISAMAQDYSRSLLSERIKREAEEYILDKATDLGVSITADIHLSWDDIPIPTEVILSGSSDPTVKKQLETLIAQDLGIAKENQTWIQASSPAP